MRLAKLCLPVCLSIAACTSGSDPDDTDTDVTSADDTQETDDEAEDDDETEDDEVPDTDVDPDTDDTDVDLDTDDTDVVAVDLDGDGFTAGVDCDDDNEDINPDADELCNDVDDDCDRDVDEDDAVDAGTWYLDLDGDNAGDPEQPTTACDVPVGYVASDSDCDETDATRYLGAPETCDGDDEDCDSDIDEDPIDGDAWYADEDGDGYFGTLVRRSCDPVADASTVQDDCRDDLETVFPGALELCDGVANDCDTAAGWTFATEEGVVTRYDEEGPPVDVSGAFAGDVDLVDGATYVVCPGTYDVHLYAEDAAATVEGLPNHEPTLTGNTTHQVVTVEPGAGVSLRNVQLVDGASGNGGLVAAYGWFGMSGGAMRNGTAVDGGCLYAAGLGSLVTLTSVTVSGCVAEGSGGGLWSDIQRLEVFGGNFSGNEARIGGAMFLAGGNAEVSGKLEENAATAAGGAVAMLGGALTLNALVAANEAPFGAGVYIEAYARTRLIGAGQLVLNEATTAGGGVCILAPQGDTVELGALGISANAAERGGGVYVQSSGTTRLFQTAIGSNTADTGGGYLGLFGVHELRGAYVFSNQATGQGAGGVALVDATGFLEDGFITNNVAETGAAGGLLLQGFDGYVWKTYLFDNRSASNGGGVSVFQSTVDFDSASVVNNAADADGGGLHVSGTSTVNLKGGWVMLNTAARGGGVFVDATSALTSAGSVFSQNRTESVDAGAGVYLDALDDAAATFTSDRADFADAGLGDNQTSAGVDGQDIYAAGTYAYGFGVSVVCDALSGCN